MEFINKHMNEELHVIEYFKDGHESYYTIVTEEYGSIAVNLAFVVKQLDEMKKDRITEFWAVFYKESNNNVERGAMNVTRMWPPVEEVKESLRASDAKEAKLSDLIGDAFKETADGESANHKVDAVAEKSSNGWEDAMLAKIQNTIHAITDIVNRDLFLDTNEMMMDAFRMMIRETYSIGFNNAIKSNKAVRNA